MARRTSDHLRSHLSVFEAEYPIQKGYIARLLIVDGRSAHDVLNEVQSIVQAAEPEKHLNEGSTNTKIYAFKRLLMAKRRFLTGEWPSLIRLFLQPFPITFKKIPVIPASLQPEHKPCHHMELSETSICDTNSTRKADIVSTALLKMIKHDHDYIGHLEVKHGKAACDKDEEVDTLEDISLASEPSDICDKVSSNSPNHNTHTCADVEENRTVVYNSHSSVCVRENVLSDRTSNHLVKTSESINEEMCYTEDVRSGKNENKQAQKGSTQSASISNRWKTKSVASQKSYQPSVSQSVQPPLLQSVQPSVLQSDKPSLLQSVQPPVLQCVQSPVLQSDQSSVLQSDQSSVVQSYKCKFCRHEFLLNSSLKEHRLVQKGILPHICSNCGHAFRLGAVLMKHTNKQAETNTGKSAQFGDKLSVLHNNQSTVLQSYKCKICHHGFLLNCSLKEHEQVQKGVLPFPCSNCGLDRVLIKHTNKETEKKADISAQYDEKFYIGGTFQKRIYLYGIKHTEKKYYMCDLCCLIFPMNSLLEKHTRTHLGEKPFKCDVCHHFLALEHSFHTHTLTHADEKPYQCDTCGRTFKNRINFMRHSITHGDNNPFKCDVCGHANQSKSNLLEHKRIHTGEKPYLCDICGQSFAQSSALKVHKRLHTKERPYQCDVCGVTFVQSCSLRTHKMIHTGEKPYECDICGFRVNRKDNLKLHKKVHKT